MKLGGMWAFVFWSDGFLWIWNPDSAAEGSHSDRSLSLCVDSDVTKRLPDQSAVFPDELDEVSVYQLHTNENQICGRKCFFFTAADSSFNAKFSITYY